MKVRCRNWWAPNGKSRAAVRNTRLWHWATTAMPPWALHRRILLEEAIPTAAALSQVTKRPSTQGVFPAFLNNYVKESNHIYKSKWMGKDGSSMHCFCECFPLYWLLREEERQHCVWKSLQQSFQVGTAEIVLFKQSSGHSLHLWACPCPYKEHKGICRAAFIPM